MRTLNAKVTLGLIALSLIVLAIFHEVSDFANGTSGPQVQVSIPNGASGVLIGDILQAEKVIKSIFGFLKVCLPSRGKSADQIASIYIRN